MCACRPIRLSSQSAAAHSDCKSVDTSFHAIVNPRGSGLRGCWASGLSRWPIDRSIEEHSDGRTGVVQWRSEAGGRRWETPMTTATGEMGATVRRIVNTSGTADAGAIPVSPSTADRCGGRATRVPSTSGRCVGRALRVWRGEA